MRTCVRVGAPRSCTPISTPSTPRSSSATTRALRGRPVIVGGGVVLAASYEAKAFGVRTAMGGRAGAPALPARDRRAARAWRPTREASKAVFASSRTRRRSSRGCRSTRRSSTCAGCERIAGTPARDRRAAAAPTCSSEVGLPITVGVARTKFLAKVASGVAKPDGLLVVPPDRELAFLHPLPVERLWGVGPVTAAQAARAAASRPCGEVARMHGGRARRDRSGRASGRHLHALAHNRDPRRVRTRPPAPLDRLAARARPRPDRRRASTRRSSAWSTASRAACAPPAASAARSSCGCASTTSRARRARTRSPRRRPRRARCSPPRAGCWPPRCRRSSARASRSSASRSRTSTTTTLQLALPLDRADAALDAALDEVRERFGVGRDHPGRAARPLAGLTVPLLPD